MKGYVPVTSIALQDEEGNVLTIILETNHMSWKLFSTYLKVGQPASSVDHSTWWNFVDPERAKENFDEKVTEAEASGWKRQA